MSQPSQTLREPAREEIVLQVEALKEHEVGEVQREGAGEAVRSEAENPELPELTDSSVRYLTDEADAGEAEGGDEGAILVAHDPDPIAGRVGCVPHDAILVGGLG